MTMQYDLNRINTLTASDLEFIRQQGEDARRALSDAVTGLLSTPEGWCVCAEFRTEFGGFFLSSAASARTAAMTGICACAAPAKSRLTGFWCCSPPVVKWCVPFTRATRSSLTG